MATRKKITPSDLRAMRARLEETQEEFGARFGVGGPALSRWEQYIPDKGTARMLIERVMGELAREVA